MVVRRRQPGAEAVEGLVLRAFERAAASSLGVCAVLLEYSLEQGLLVAERAVEAALAETVARERSSTEVPW